MRRKTSSGTHLLPRLQNNKGDGELKVGDNQIRSRQGRLSNLRANNPRLLDLRCNLVSSRRNNHHSNPDSRNRALHHSNPDSNHSSRSRQGWATRWCEDRALRFLRTLRSQLIQGTATSYASTAGSRATLWGTVRNLSSASSAQSRDTI